MTMTANFAELEVAKRSGDTRTRLALRATGLVATAINVSLGNVSLGLHWIVPRSGSA